MKKLAVIFGGMSTEHDVSIVSGSSVLANLDQTKYEIYPIYISKDGKWYFYEEEISKIRVFQVGEEPDKLQPIQDIMQELQKMDVVFPVLHGLYGEDGSIQGLLELLKIPYVGCKVLASSVSMDKVYTKIIFERAQIKQTPYCYIHKYGEEYEYIDRQMNHIKCKKQEILERIIHKLAFPMFVKPSNSGSSVGVTKANNEKELEEAISIAGKYDNKILVEQGIIGREVECAVLGNKEAKASCVGEIKSAEDFYSFDSKYKNSKSYTEIPANIGEHLAEEIRNLAVKAFQAVDGKGLARVDFFIENSTNEIYINEINTMPGFTQISMYPKLWEAVGVSYSKLLDELIALAVE